MTYFSGEDQSTNTEDYIAKIVSEKGEQWKDPATLAKGYLSAQEFIKTLQKEKDELLQDMKKQDYAKEVLDTLSRTTKPNVSQETQTQTAPVVNEQDLKALIQETITTAERQKTSEQNIKAVDQKLVELFGTEASKVVEERRQSLGLSREKLKEIASESPTAFLRLIGEPETKQTNRTVSSTVNTSTSLFNQTSSVRDFAYYQKLRKEQPSQYHSPSTRRAMEADLMAMGPDKFYNRSN